MANEKNLKRWGKEIPPPTSEEAQKNGQKGGKASAEARKNLATFKHYLELALSKTVKDKDGNEHTYKEVGAIKLVEKYVQGDAKAQELVLRVTGEMPSEKTEITGLDGSPLMAPSITVTPVRVVSKDGE